MTRIEKCNLAIKKGFTYDELSGFINSPTGKIVTKKIKSGYILLTLRDGINKTYYLYGHQFAWFFKYNEIVDFIDHKNRIKHDNSILNLRSVTKSQNAMNMSNVKGYFFSKKNKKYIAFIMLNYKSKQLGSFDSPEEARDCYLKNKLKYHLIN